MMAAQNMCRNTLVITAAVLVHAWSGMLCAPLCLSGDFDSQLQHILHEQMLSEQDIANITSRVLADLKITLNQRWQGFEAIPYGSLTTGLGLKSSDVDFYIKIPNSNIYTGLYVLQETEKLFKKEPQRYSHLRSLFRDTFSVINLIHTSSERREVDLFFEYGEVAVANSKLIKYFFHLDKRFVPLGCFLKYWFKIQKQHGYLLPINYSVYLYIIFYLQQKNMAPPIYVLQKDSKSHFIHDWDVGFNELPYRSTNTENLHQLLGGFFKFYSEFNFEEYVVAPYTGRPIRKSAFLKIENFPKEYSSYKNNLTNTLQHRIKNDLYNISSAVCLQDPFIHSYNLLEWRTSQEFADFKYLMKSVATMFEALPSDSILRAILVIDRHNETVKRHKKATVDVINEQDCIEVA